MQSNRRNFLKISGLAGISLIGSPVLKAAEETASKKRTDRPRAQHFNMSGYAAPKLDTVRIGFVGLGNRGPGAVDRMSHIEGTEIKGLCDIRPERVAFIQEKLKGSKHNPVCFSGEEEGWKKR